MFIYRDGLSNSSEKNNLESLISRVERTEKYIIKFKLIYSLSIKLSGSRVGWWHSSSGSALRPFFRVDSTLKSN